jgi:hypothetical protein
MQLLRFVIDGRLTFVSSSHLVTAVVRYLRGEPPSMLVTARRVTGGDDGETSAQMAFIDRDRRHHEGSREPRPKPWHESPDPEVQRMWANTIDMINDQAFAELRAAPKDASASGRPERRTGPPRHDPVGYHFG